MREVDPRAVPIRVVVIGVTGRMGQALLRAASGFPRLVVSGAIASRGSPALGRDAGEAAGIAPANVPVTSDLAGALAEANVALDFSSAEATAANLEACRAAGTALLIGTTGFGAQLEGALAGAAREIPLLIAPNTSLGITLLSELTARAARALDEFDIGIFEAHHRAKRDAPSGTALALGRAAQEARAGGSSRAAGGVAGREIGYASLRAGDLIGEHTVLLAGPGEQLSLTHRTTDRAVFARGALAAALWLASRPPGRYTMRDFLLGKTNT